MKSIQKSGRDTLILKMEHRNDLMNVLQVSVCTSSRGGNVKIVIAKSFVYSVQIAISDAAEEAIYLGLAKNQVEPQNPLILFALYLTTLVTVTKVVFAPFAATRM